MPSMHDQNDSLSTPLPETVFLPPGGNNKNESEPTVAPPNSRSTWSWGGVEPGQEYDPKPVAESVHGHRIGKYVLVDEIGSGGMGRVFKAWDPELRRHVALKMISSGVWASNTERDYFVREGLAMARLRHANIVTVFDAELQKHPPYFVMEYHETGSLADHFNEFLADQRAGVDLIEKVARAVHYLHGQNFIHRDLKPSNILLDEHKQPKVSDFGLVKMLHHGEDTSRSANQVGTPDYMSPEQTELVHEEITRQTDVWALGVMLYKLLTGKMPFSGTNRSELYRKIIHDDPVPPRTYRPDLDRGLEAVVLKCLSKEPQRRFTDAGELADELGRWLRNEPLKTVPQTFVQRMARTIRRRPAFTAACFVSFVAVVLAPLLSYFLGPERSREEIERRLAQGKSVEFIGVQGGPRWWQLIEPNGTIADIGADGLFAVQSWKDVGLVELVPQLPFDRFRLSAEVKHEAAQPMGEVGLYVMHGRWSDPLSTVDVLWRVAFNDVIADAPTRVIPEGALREFIRPENPVAAAPIVRVAPVGEEAFVRRISAGVKTPEFLPAGLDKGFWRKIVIEVSPTTVQAWFDGMPSKAVTYSKVEPSIRKNLEQVNQAHHPVRLDPKGAIGLYVNRGVAVFRHVTIEPMGND